MGITLGDDGLPKKMSSASEEKQNDETFNYLLQTTLQMSPQQRSVVKSF